MLRIIWRFRVKPKKVEEFQKIYSWKGPWAKLFGKSREYQGTILMQNVSDPLIFVVVDRWALEDSFERFRKQFGPDYERLDELCKSLTDEETLVGMFRDEVV
jgi:quinol monooxygenase YgiN